VAIEALDDDCVLPPFSPVRVSEGATVHVWNRAHALGAWCLPEAVTTQGASILAGSITLSLISEGGNVLPAGPAPTASNTGKGVARFRAQAENAKLSANVACRYEFDGFSLYTVEILPKTALRVDRFELDVPVKAEHAIYLLASGQPTERTTHGPLQFDREFAMPLGVRVRDSRAQGAAHDLPQRPPAREAPDPSWRRDCVEKG